MPPSTRRIPQPSRNRSRKEACADQSLEGEVCGARPSSHTPSIGLPLRVGPATISGRSQSARHETSHSGKARDHGRVDMLAGLSELRDYSMLLLRLYIPFRLLPWRKLGRRKRNLLVRDAAEQVGNAVQASTLFVV
jgi:hypothetical protein